VKDPISQKQTKERHGVKKRRRKKKKRERKETKRNKKEEEKLHVLSQIKARRSYAFKRVHHTLCTGPCSI